jgi:hypothetical protein
MHKWLQAPEADKPLTASAPLIARKNIEAVVSRKRKRTDGSVMRRYFVAQGAAAVAAIGLGGLELLIHQAQLLLQQVDLLLLAGNGAVEAVEQVVLEGDFHFQFSQAVFGIHACILPWPAHGRLLDDVVVME